MNHPDWADPLPPPVDITDAGPEGREDQIEKEGEASPSVPSGSAPSARSWSVVEHEPGDTPVKAKDLFPATPDLPLRVVAAVKRTGNAGQSRIHLLNVEGTAVGCGWRPAASKVQELLVLDYITEQEAYGSFKRHGFPADWALEPAEVPTLQEDSDSLTDSGSETDDSVDTQSETEVVARCPRPWRPRGWGAQRGAIAGALSTDWHPLSFRNGAGDLLPNQDGRQRLVQLGHVLLELVWDLIRGLGRHDPRPWCGWVGFSTKLGSESPRAKLEPKWPGPLWSSISNTVHVSTCVSTLTKCMQANQTAPHTSTR